MKIIEEEMEKVSGAVKTEDKSSESGDMITACIGSLVMFNLGAWITDFQEVSWSMDAVFGFALLITVLFTAKPKGVGNHILLGIGLTVVWTLFLTGIFCCSIRQLFEEANTVALIGISAALAVPTILLNRLFRWLGKHMDEWTEKLANS